MNLAARTARAMIAAIIQHNGPNDPRIPHLRTILATEKLAEDITRVIESAPPPTPAQIERLALLLQPGAGHD
jgi:hypothetical protein